MVRRYAPRDFLRRAPNALLGRYFHENNLLMDVDIAALGESDIATVFDAWEALPSADRARVESDFQLVDELANEQGLGAVIEEGRFHGLNLASALEEMDGFHAKVLWTLLDHPRVIDVAARFYDADHLPGNAWKRRREAVPGITPRDDGAACDELARAVGAYFRARQGRGRACAVEVYRRETRYYYFAYPEDYASTSIEFDVDDRLQRRPGHRPTFEVVFVYDPSLPALDTFARGPRQTRLDLEDIFARVILLSELREVRDEKVYELSRFKRPGVRFIYDPSSGIEDVRVKQLRCAIIGGGRTRLTIDGDTSQDRDGLYRFMERVVETGSRTEGEPDRGRLPLALLNVTKVGLEARFARGTGRGRRTKTFFLTFPNGCSLGHDGRDGILRRMLIDSGIEPSRPGGGAPPL